MTANPKRNPNPWEGMTYEGLASLAREVLGQAADEPEGSVERAMKIATYDAIVNEFKKRVLVYAAIKFELPPAPVSDEALAGWKLAITDFPDLEL